MIDSSLRIELEKSSTCILRCLLIRSGVIKAPRSSVTTVSIKFLNSRILPCHGKLFNKSSASKETPLHSIPNLRATLSLKNSINREYLQDVSLRQVIVNGQSLI